MPRNRAEKPRRAACGGRKGLWGAEKARDDRRLRPLQGGPAPARGPDPARGRRRLRLGRAGRVRLGRPARARDRGDATGGGAVRPPRARRRGRFPRPPAAEARGLRGLLLHRPQDRPLPRRVRDRPFRRDRHLRRPRLRGPRSPRRGQRAARRAAAAAGAPRPAQGRAGGSRLGDPRPGRRRLHAGRGGDRRRHPGGRGGRLRAGDRGSDRADLLPQTRGDRVPSRDLSAPGAAGVDPAGGLPATGRAAAPLPARRLRPRPARRRDGQLAARAADLASWRRTWPWSASTRTRS